MNHLKIYYTPLVTLIMCILCSYTYTEQIYKISYYNVGDISQNDSTPCITANNTNLCKIFNNQKTYKYMYVAVPQDVFKKYKYVYISAKVVKEEYKKYFCIKGDYLEFHIVDTLNKRYNNTFSIDIAVPYNVANTNKTPRIGFIGFKSNEAKGYYK